MSVWLHLENLKNKPDTFFGLLDLLPNASTHGNIQDTSGKSNIKLYLQLLEGRSICLETCFREQIATTTTNKNIKTKPTFHRSFFDTTWFEKGGCCFEQKWTPSASSLLSSKSGCMSLNFCPGICFSCSIQGLRKHDEHIKPAKIHNPTGTKKKGALPAHLWNLPKGKKNKELMISKLKITNSFPENSSCKRNLQNWRGKILTIWIAYPPVN